MFPLAVAASLLAVPAPADTDHQRLQGPWVAVSIKLNGKVLPEGLGLEGMKVVFEKDTVIFSADVDKDNRQPFKLDEKKSPKSIDLINPGDKSPTLGIYRLDGDKLKIGLADPGQGRPKDFSAERGAWLVFELVREKKGK